MNELVSMLMPLETLSGWPTAPEPSVVGTIGLLFGFPALAFIVVFGIAKISSIVKGSPSQVDRSADPLWLGGQPGPAGEVGPGAENSPAALESARQNEAVDNPGTGGVSARW